MLWQSSIAQMMILPVIRARRYGCDAYRGVETAKVQLNGSQRDIRLRKEIGEMIEDSRQQTLHEMKDLLRTMLMELTGAPGQVQPFDTCRIAVSEYPIPVL